MPRPLKRRSNGFIDDSDILNIIVGRMKLTYDILEKLTYPELLMLIDDYNENQKDHYEMMAYAFRVGYVSAHNGKKIDMFGRYDTASTKQTSKEERDKELAYLIETFGNTAK